MTQGDSSRKSQRKHELHVKLSQASPSLDEVSVYDFKIRKQSVPISKSKTRVDINKSRKVFLLLLKRILDHCQYIWQNVP